MMSRTIILTPVLLVVMSSFALADQVFTAAPDNKIQLCTIKNNCPPPIPQAPTPTPQPPKYQGPSINLNLGLGGGYGGNYGGSYADDGISCSQGRSIVRHRGFKRVRTMDCSGDVFAYSAFKNGQSVEVDVGMAGNIVDVSSND